MVFGAETNRSCVTHKFIVFCDMWIIQEGILLESAEIMYL